jgi:hypothetical protein
MGVTFLFASGDNGVAGGVGGMGGYCLTADGNTEYIAYLRDPRLISSQEVKPLTAQSLTPASLVHVRMSLRSVLLRLALASLYGNPRMRVRMPYTLAVDSATTLVCLTIRRLPSKGIWQLIRSHTRRTSTTRPGYESNSFV